MARKSVIHSNSKQFMLAVFMNYVIISNINENTSTVKIQEQSDRTTNNLVTWTKEKILKSLFINMTKAALVNFWHPLDLDPLLWLFIFFLPHFSTLPNYPSTISMGKDRILVFLHSKFRRDGNWLSQWSMALCYK